MNYDRWLKMLQKVICRYRLDADIVFWAYNWGKCAREDRLKLIDSMPKGISLMATFEMFECLPNRRSEVHRGRLHHRLSRGRTILHQRGGALQSPRYTAVYPSEQRRPDVGLRCDSV